MSTARILTAVLSGTRGHLVTVEASASPGPSSVMLTGLPGGMYRETRDRVFAAIVNSREKWPSCRVAIRLYPVSQPKRASTLDLAVAVAMMTAAGDVPAPAPGTALIAELGLDGSLRPVPDLLPAVLAAATAELDTVVVAAASHAQAVQVPGITVIACESLADVTAWLRGGTAPRPPDPPPGGGGTPDGARQPPDLADFPGRADARIAAEACAAGGHHLSLIGPGPGPSMLAERLPGILPDLDSKAAAEVTLIHALAGLLPPGLGRMTRPPFCAPPADITVAAMTGRAPDRPGQASLAHRGILLLPNAPDFSRAVLDALRQPLESGEVVITRGAHRAAFPARFTLVLTASPCPCTQTTAESPVCTCTSGDRRRYLARLSEPLLDRIDLKASIRQLDRASLRGAIENAEPSASVAARVTDARDRAAARLAGTPWQLNSEVPASEMRKRFPPDTRAITMLDRATSLGQVSSHSADKIITVAWTLADLAGHQRPGPKEVSRALALRLGVPHDAQRW